MSFGSSLPGIRFIGQAQLPAPNRILVAEDDPAVRKALKRMLEMEGFNVDAQSDGLLALNSFHSKPPCLVLLDLRLPKLSGQDLCRQIKAEDPSVPIIVVSASSESFDKILLLEMGAEDYVTKPFSPRELLARVRVALRRCTLPDTASQITFDGIVVDLRKLAVTRNSQPVTLTVHEFKTLLCFLRNPGRVVTRAELSKAACDFGELSPTRTVDNHIMRLRHKLEKDPGNPTHFRTIHRVGYKFVP